MESSPVTPVTVLGYDIYFPDGKKPFPAQLAVISKTLQALTRKQNALLESPTGTGKTLALLTSTLSWQKKEKLLAKQKAQTPPAPPLNEATPAPGVGEAPPDQNQKMDAPKIYFCSRTHSQLQQAISELKSCHKSYLDQDFTMSLLAGKIHLCINEKLLTESRVNGILNKDTLDELCKASQPKRKRRFDQYTCPFTTSSLGRTFLDSKIWDIEDAHHLGRAERCCPYFTASKLAETADIVFLPYIYLIDPVIRYRSPISLANSVVIIDEAHNLEDTCRSAASIEVSPYQLREAIKFLDLIEKYGAFCREAARGLRDWMNKIIEWIERSRHTLECNGFEVESRTWTSREALVVFENEIELSEETLKIYEQYFGTIVEFTEKEDKDDSDWSSHDIAGAEPSDRNRDLIARLFANCRPILERLFVVLDFMTAKDPSYIEAYRVVIQKARNQKNSKLELSLNIWCLSAHVAFRSFANSCHSILLTSGTLSPLNSFERELGVSFPVRVEAQHVIDTASQVYVRAVSTFDNTLMTSSYLNQSNLTYLDTIGRSLLSLTRVTTGGVLAFFASYSFMDKIKERWIATGFDQDFDNSGTYTDDYRGTKLFFEPKESEKLESILNDYYDTIDQGKQGLFLAVCRGKVSEGIDFSDNYARTVVVYGIPFPNLGALEIKLKRNYLDDMCSKHPDSSYLTGDMWYEQQAFRAVNQAFGRCIRHIKDFGAIILCDPRYQKSHNQQQLSKWVRSNVVNSSRLEDVLLPLRLFFGANFEKFSDHLDAIEEKRRKKKPSLTSSSNSSKKRKKPKKTEIAYDLTSEEEHKVSEGQQTLSQIYGRYLQSTKTTETIHHEGVSEDRKQIRNCLLQWDWNPAHNDDGELVQMKPIGTSLLLESIPIQLQYLITNFSSPTAIRISEWTWPSPESCVCIRQELLSLVQTIKSCICQYRVVEEWNSIDRVVYRLLVCPSNGSHTSAPTLLAATVLAASELGTSFINSSYVNWNVLQDIFQESSLEDCPIEPIECILDESSIDCNFDEIVLNDCDVSRVTETSTIEDSLNDCNSRTFMDLSTYLDEDDEDFEPEPYHPRKRHDRVIKKEKR